MSGSPRVWERLGFSLSLYFAQSFNERALHEVDGIQDVSVMNDRTLSCVLDISHPGQVFGYVYADNLGLLPLNLWRTQEGSSHLKTSSMRWVCGPAWRAWEEAVQTKLGQVLDCRQHVTKTSLAGWWRLRRGLGALLKRKVVTGATVEKHPRYAHL